MKCADCGKDAVCLATLGYQVSWAFCKACAKRRMLKAKGFWGQCDTEDLDDEVYPK